MPRIADGKFVVVGGASLLGSHLGEQLLAAGAGEVVLMDNLALGTVDNIAQLLSDKRCSFLRGDMLRLNELFDPFRGADGVFQVAGYLWQPFRDDPWSGIDVNMRGVQNVLEASRIMGVEKVVSSSSVGVYGIVNEASSSAENAPFQWEELPPTVTLYSATKIAGEALGKHYVETYGLGYLGLRYSNLYGERLHRRALQATRMIMAYDEIRAGRRPTVAPEYWRAVHDYIYIGDVARANHPGDGKRRQRCRHEHRAGGIGVAAPHRGAGSQGLRLRSRTPAAGGSGA